MVAEHDEFNVFVSAVVSAIKAWFKPGDAARPALVSCESHPGRFDEAELRRFATAAPAIRVACLGFADLGANASCQSNVMLQMGVFVITRNQPGETRDAVALNLLRGLSRLVPQNRWGLNFTHDPEHIRAQNLYGATINQQGVSLWALSWEQLLSIGEPDMFSWDTGIDGEIPSRVWAGFEPNVGLEHRDHYTQVSDP